MSAKILGNVFRPGKGAVLCDLECQRDVIVARPREEDASIEFPLDEQSVSLGGDAGSQLVVTNKDGATLYAERKALEPLIANNASPFLRSKLSTETTRVNRSNQKAHLALVVFILGVVLLAGAGVGVLNWTVDRAVDQIPVSWEEKLGETVAANTEGQEIVDRAIVEPVQAVLDRLVAAAGDQPYTMKLHVLQSEAVNAYAAPGGHIIVLTGLLEKTKTPEELAGVLGHELQHVLGRHGLRNMVHSLKWHLVASLLVGDVGSVQQVVVSQAPRFLSLSYGRSLEQEADLEGTQLMAKAGINPSGLRDFFAILKAQEEQMLVPPEFLSSHPETQKRIDDLEAFLKEHPADIPPMDVGWDAMHKALDELDQASPKLQD